VTGPRVVTASGTLEGETVEADVGASVRRFLGVPYAAAPEGSRRWRRPARPEPWRGVRAARVFGPAAPQTAGLPSVLPSFRPAVTAEDCLTLNVWTPALDGHRPVLVWIHGGAFTSGGSSQPVYDGARLAAEHDLVVVTLNYRLGALGFLSPPDAAGDRVANAGLHDQLAALAWVREHAGGFGGDPSSVTVVGESAGAGSILHLLTAAGGPQSFDRAIAQSGEPRTLTQEQGATVAATFTRMVEAHGGDAARLESTPLPVLLAAQDAVARELFGTVGVMVYAPTVDGEFLADDVLAATAGGRGADVAVVLGTTRDELRLFPDPTSDTLDPERLRRRVARLVPASDPISTVSAYRVQLGAGATNGDVWEAVRTDALMRIPNLRLAEARAANDATTFLYRFDWAAPHLGAAYAVDLPFTFGTFDRESWGTAVGADAAAEALGRALRASWAAFARDAVPSTDDVAWPAYEPARRATMLFDRMSRVVDDPDAPIRGCYA
jgi:para-nitrobenzyl esterase